MGRSALLALLSVVAGCGDDAGPEADGGGDAGPIDGGPSDADFGDADSPDARRPALEWPSAEAPATSDPWIIEHHDEITVMRPRILALNFVNARSNDEMLDLMGKIIDAIREGSRPHGYDDPAAPPFLQPEIAYAVDLRDEEPPADWPYRNSTRYPREDPQEGGWGFDYERLFGVEFAAHYGIEDPDAPGSFLRLCDLSARGLVHEVWIYGDADVPDVGAAEILGLQPRYDESFTRLPGEPNRCAGNGCFDAEDYIPDECSRTLRIGWVNNTRGVGCYLESLSHGIEWIGNGGGIPYFTRYFQPFAMFDLDERFGVGFDSWYAVCGGEPCLFYPTPRSVEYRGPGGAGRFDPFVPTCGNAHFPPNASGHYDIFSDQVVMSTCRDWRTGEGGADPETPLSAADWSRYGDLAPDCTGAWIVWWWQSFPGFAARARADDGRPVRNFWPFLYY